METTGQLSLFDLGDDAKNYSKEKYLSVVKAKFLEGEEKTWSDLFGGFDELYATTYSSGLAFTASLLEQFKYAEIIYGCEDILPGDISAVLALETSLIENFARSKSAKMMSERIKEGTLALYVSRNSISHAKIFCLKAEDGRTRVIVGSANMSQTAFGGIQKENITYYDEPEAYEWYMDKYSRFREECADNVNQKAVVCTMEDEEYLRNNPEEIPLMQTVKDKKYVFLEPESEENEADVQIVTNAKNMIKELKPMLPKEKKERGKIVVSLDSIPKIRSAVKDLHVQKKEIQKTFPKLHLDYDNGTLAFNGKEYDMDPDKEKVINDINSIEYFLSSLSNFHGDYIQAQKDYYRFMNWFFASLFMPYLRYVAYKKNYEVITFPNVGIMYGDSNGGKSTFVQLLTKLMTGKKIPATPNGDFTYTGVEKLRCGIEGVPINFDDLDRGQFRNNSDKIIKADEWGIPEMFLNYPAIVVTTNKLPSLEAPIQKRVVGIRIDVRIGKEEGLANSRSLKEAISNASTAFYSEYVKRMLPLVKSMAERMKDEEEKYYADIFELSSRIIVEIITEFKGEVPPYIRQLTFSDYYGDRVTGRTAIKKIHEAWISEKKAFKVDRKKNLLIYSVPDSATYDIKYLQDELPPQLEAHKLPSSLTMNLAEAEKFFGMKFKNGIFG